jgi:hypothetical protein
MNKEFIPYEQALELKQLGFDEECFGFFNIKGKFIKDFGITKDIMDNLGLQHLELVENICVSPTYQQAFRWFREKYNLRSFVDTRVYDVDSPNQWIYDFQIKMGNGVDTQPFYSGDFDTYEEAELACLIKLIEIVKQPKP